MRKNIKIAISGAILFVMLFGQFGQIYASDEVFESPLKVVYGEDDSIVDFKDGELDFTIKGSGFEILVNVSSLHALVPDDLFAHSNNELDLYIHLLDVIDEALNNEQSLVEIQKSILDELISFVFFEPIAMSKIAYFRQGLFEKEKISTQDLGILKSLEQEFMPGGIIEELDFVLIHIFSENVTTDSSPSTSHNQGAPLFVDLGKLEDSKERVFNDRARPTESIDPVASGQVQSISNQAQVPTFDQVQKVAQQVQVYEIFYRISEDETLLIATLFGQGRLDFEKEKQIVSVLHRKMPKDFHIHYLVDSEKLLLSKEGLLIVSKLEDSLKELTELEVIYPGLEVISFLKDI